jgi:hypothetical protein
VKTLLPVLVFVTFFLIGFLVARKIARSSIRQDRAELKRLRKMRDDLTSQAYAHMVSEPFAMIVLDIISESQPKELE